jgi:HlyD family secretion protein
MKATILNIFLAALVVSGCRKQADIADASGTFETVETIVSSEANGLILQLSISEGQELAAGARIGYIDSTQLYLKKKQLQAQINAVLSRRPDAASQLAVLNEQLKHSEAELERFKRLLASDAATQKQVDDAAAQVAVIRKQISAQESSLGIAVYSLGEETLPLSVQVEQLNDQLAGCRIVNPVKGTVLVKYAEVNEMTAVGKPLYKVADLSQMILRAYITNDQFSKAKVGQKVQVLADNGNEGYKTYDGVIGWISDKAEFTPKTIQTRDERANLVYAVKVNVKNDDFLKIGMYGELRLNTDK